MKLICKRGHPRTPENVTKNRTCKICMNERKMTHYYRNHELFRTQRSLKYSSVREKDKALQKNYGITLADFTRLYEGQGGRCAICNQSEKLVVDHDHGTGKVRGLLCTKCNLMILPVIEHHNSLIQIARNYLHAQNTPVF